MKMVFRRTGPLFFYFTALALIATLSTAPYFRYYPVVLGIVLVIIVTALLWPVVVVKEKAILIPGLLRRATVLRYSDIMDVESDENERELSIMMRDGKQHKISLAMLGKRSRSVLLEVVNNMIRREPFDNVTLDA